MSLLAFLLSAALADSMAPPGSPDASAPPVHQQAAERWVVVCLCATGTWWSESRIAVNVESVDSAGNGVYHARMRGGSWGAGRKESYVVQIDQVQYRYDRKIWRASFDCVNRRVRLGPATYYHGSTVLPGGEPDDAPRGPWLGATPIEPEGPLLDAFCRFHWKKPNRRG